MRRAVLFVLFLLIAATSPAQAKSYSYDNIQTNLTFMENGSVLVEQTRNYDFQGDFSWAYIELKKSGADDVKVITVKDVGSNLVLPFTVADSSGSVTVNWQYSAHYENKVFLIVYVIDGSVKRYEDVAEFYWKVIEDEHEPIEYLETNIYLPRESPNIFKVFVHSQGENGNLAFSEDNKSSMFTLGNIPRDTFVESRILMEPSVFPNVKAENKAMYEKILNDEKKIFRPNTLVLLLVVAFIVPILYIILVVGFLIHFYLKYGREPKVEYDGVYEREPPMGIPPFALGCLMDPSVSIQTSAKGLIATVFDFAVRSFITINEEERKGILGIGKKTVHKFALTKKGKDPKIKDKMTTFEYKVFSLFFRKISEDGESVDTEQIREWTMKNRSFRAQLTNMGKEVKSWFEKNHFDIYAKDSVKARNKFLVILTVMSVIGFVLGGFLVFWLYLISFISTLLFSASIYRRTPDSALQFKKWKAFRKFMTDFTDMKNAPKNLLYIWDRYLVYAVVLGVAEKLLENLKDFVTESNQKIMAPVWYHSVSGIYTGTLTPSAFSSLSHSLSSSISSITTSSAAFSTSSSHGGGFSGGGGGGGGGGSSGAG
ncbi:hypothetical protein A3K63_04680 [Candidatus Micrarchaeota archaeon RBG_16_49_10]|nr:MAG: hypothetical protein A3K63_04680 [Candidatus Micrarchaeota archaeon RBG_16_49_10]